MCECSCTGREETCIEGGILREDAEFFTIYGRLYFGGCEALTDCNTFEDAEGVAGYLSRLSGLAVQVNC